MYEAHFQFSSRPFSSAPAIDAFFPAESIEAARQTLVRTIDRAEGVGLAVGPAGVGKTLLCRLLAARFQESFNVAMLSSARVVTRKSLLQNILFELGLEYRGLEEGELRLSLLDYLQPNEHCPNGMLLIVDEAHNLGLRLLEEIRMITNLVRDGQPRVRLVLAGGPKLEERFTSPKLESFNQRITARCYLHGFSRDETSEYVRSRLTAVGAVPSSVFTDDGLNAIHQATDGIPRLVNQVCDHALVMGFAGGKQTINGSGIQEAWADLQQLPGPWQPEAATSGDSAVVEFGSLDDDESGVESEVSEMVGSDAFETQPLETAVVTTRALDNSEYQQPEPEACSPPPAAVETHDPFGEVFEEEVIVVDRTTVQESTIFSGRPRVQSVEGQALAAALQNAEAACGDSPQAPEISIEPDVDEEPVAESQPDPIVNADDPPAATSAMFEYTVFEQSNSAELALQTLCEVNIAMGELDEQTKPEAETPTVKISDHQDSLVDDRSLIVVESDTDHIVVKAPVAGTESPHQVEYQELFTQLRHG
ncbi:MAG: hypothetical protein CMJ64_25575 [Planctomycetaceae bacterium]|nr:hypothetical protein [Planctomycetaceae bacterium]